MRDGADEHEHMEDLVAMPDDIEHAGTPLLRDTADIEPGPDGVRQPHGHLEPEREVARGVAPVDPESVQRRDDTGQAHCEEQRGTQPAVPRRGAGRREQHGHDERAQGGDGGEVGDARGAVAEEGVVDGRDEGGDDHDGDARVVQLPEDDRGAARVAGQQVRRAARGQARHGAHQEHHPRPPRHAQLRRCRRLAVRAPRQALHHIQKTQTKHHASVLISYCQIP